MAKLYYTFSTMNAGKSAQLLQAAHNYEQNGNTVWYFNFIGDTRHGIGKISSRIGLEHSAVMFDADFDFIQYFIANDNDWPSAIFVDECQFLTGDQVLQLASIVDNQSVPVLCYGIRNDYMGQLFPGSSHLLCHADEIREIKTMCCHPGCQKKATHIALHINDQRVYQGDQTFIGDTEYRSLCRNHFMQGLHEHI
ncbi:thymidine kinase [Vibrio phage 1.081.O._10N.286.52.C2]|nr:thymidine kinase [Vibrio phage 1.081.O._10N.286.52.C2]